MNELLLQAITFFAMLHSSEDKSVDPIFPGIVFTPQYALGGEKERRKERGDGERKARTVLTTVTNTCSLASGPVISHPC